MQGKAAVHNSLIEKTVQLKDHCYVENSWLKGNTVLREGSVVSCLELKDVEVPSMVLHGVVLRKTEQNGKHLVRAYGSKDNPKKTQKAEVFWLEISGAFWKIMAWKQKISGKRKIILCGKQSCIRRLTVRKKQYPGHFFFSI